MKSAKLFSFLICISFFFRTMECRATHAFGAELTYTCIDQNTYVIWYTLYRDCSGIVPTSNMAITVTNTCGFPVQNFNIPQIGPPVELAPLCPQDTPSICNGGIRMGVQKY